MGKTSDRLSDKVRSVARQHRYNAADPNNGDNTGGPILPTHNSSNTTSTLSNSGGLDEKDGGRLASAGGSLRSGGGKAGDGKSGGRGRVGGSHTQAAADDDLERGRADSIYPGASPQDKSEAARSGDPAVGNTDGATDGTDGPKPPIGKRMIAGSKRFVIHTKDALCHSWVNVLLLFVPVGIAAEAAGLSPTIIFALNAIAIVPLAGLLSHATESVASRLGDTIGALLNVTFGNAVELIIFIIALVKNEIRIVQASLLGSILANLLLILGMAFLFGGLRFREQIYNSTVTQMSACLLSLSVMSLLLPTAFHASFNENNTNQADSRVLAVSRGTSVVLLLVYVLYLLFQLKSHAYLYESTPQEIIDEESHPGVLADMLNSSSSSDSSSSSSDSDSDSSGSVKTAGKRFKRMIKNRRRRKSSASTNSTPSVPSALSSPSTTMERQNSYWEHATLAPQQSNPETALSPITGGDGNEADVEDLRSPAPRVRDFGGDPNGEPPLESKPTENKKSKKKSKKHHKKRHSQIAEEGAEMSEKPPIGYDVQEASPGPRVGFAESVEVAEAQSGPDAVQGRRPFNMRGLSRAPAFRPGLTKMLSNNVFVTPPPAFVPQSTSQSPARGRTGLRRTNSLPDRLNRQNTPTSNNQQQPTYVRNGPLPPFQHQRTSIRKVRSQNSEVDEEVDEEGKPQMSRTAAIVLLLISTALVAVCAEFMVDAIPEMIAASPSVSEAFIGLIILPIVGNAAEHVTAVTVAAKNKMDLAIGVAVGSSIQIALFVTPIVVLLGWILKTEMSLYFNLFETISLFVTAFVVNFLVLDGRSNYLEGSLLIAAYVIIAVGAFYYPDSNAQSALGGGEATGDAVRMMMKF